MKNTLEKVIRQILVATRDYLLHKEHCVSCALAIDPSAGCLDGRELWRAACRLNEERNGKYKDGTEPIKTLDPLFFDVDTNLRMTAYAHRNIKRGKKK